MIETSAIHLPKLRDKREAAGISRQRLAEIAGVSIGTIAAVERGLSCSPAMAEKLLGALEAYPHSGTVEGQKVEA